MSEEVQQECVSGFQTCHKPQLAIAGKFVQIHCGDMTIMELVQRKQQHLPFRSCVVVVFIFLPNELFGESHNSLMKVFQSSSHRLFDQIQRSKLCNQFRELAIEYSLTIFIVDRINLQFVQSALRESFSGKLVLFCSVPVEMPVGKSFRKLVIIGSGLCGQNSQSGETRVVEGFRGCGAS